MTDENSPDGSGTTHTSIEVDREVWRQVRAEAVAEGTNISEKLEEILREYFDMENSDA